VPNAELRTREYLTEAEVERLIKAAKANRHGQRDATMILITFRHGLRAAELVDLRWDQVDLGRNACLHVRRVKNGIPHHLAHDFLVVVFDFGTSLRGVTEDGGRRKRQLTS
jgi:integrase